MRFITILAFFAPAIMAAAIPEPEAVAEALPKVPIGDSGDIIEPKACCL